MFGLELEGSTATVWNAESNAHFPIPQHKDIVSSSGLTEEMDFLRLW